MKTTAEKIAVMQAFEDGKLIQIVKRCMSNKWNDVERPQWNWVSFDYRIKPEPREWWVNLYPNGDFGSQYPTQEEAVRANPGAETILVREVIEDEETNSIDERV